MIEKLILSYIYVTKRNLYAQSTSNTASLTPFDSFLHPRNTRTRITSKKGFLVKYLICHDVLGHLSARGVASYTRVHTSVESLPRIELTKWSMGRTTFLRD